MKKISILTILVASLIASTFGARAECTCCAAEYSHELASEIVRTAMPEKDYAAYSQSYFTSQQHSKSGMSQDWETKFLYVMKMDYNNYVQLAAAKVLEKKYTYKQLQSFAKVEQSMLRGENLVESPADMLAIYYDVILQRKLVFDSVAKINSDSAFKTVVAMNSLDETKPIMPPEGKVKAFLGWIGLR